MAQRTAKAEVKLEEASGAQIVNQYKFLSECGRGTFCKVKWAEGANGRPYAIKVFYRGVLDRQHVSHYDKDGVTTVPLKERIEEEIRLLAQLEHPNIVPLIEVIDDPAIEQLFVVLEGMEGRQLMMWDDDLACYSLGTGSASSSVSRFWGTEVRSVPSHADLEQPSVFQEAVASHLIGQLLGAVEYMHAQGVIHKDLKPDNILLSLPIPSEDHRFARLLSLKGWPELKAPVELPGAAEGEAGLQALLARFPVTAKICDFNTAAACDQPDCLIYDAEGTQVFSPPEVFEPSHDGGVRGKPRDIWSMGAVLFVMLFGRCPFWSEEAIILQLTIMQDDLVIPAGVASGPGEELIKVLLSKVPADRPTAQAALESAWLRQGARA